MIQLRKNPFSETQIDIPFIEGESAKELVDRALSENGYELSENVLSHFHVVLNGHIVERDMWAFCKIQESDTVLVGPRIARGSGGQMFKIIATIAIVAAASWAGQAWAGPGLAGALLGAGLSTAGILAINALIPPPGLPGIGGLGSLGTSFEGSQMYTITSQSNNAKKFGFVPRVYGSHRMFPVIAANPYTEIEADAQTGTLVQFYYCIYDFGFGPLDISEIKIGDTLLQDYADSHYRLVDLNKPAVSEGDWDDSLFNNFELYKGDVERDGSAIALDKNQTDAGASLDDYQVVRNASSKVNGCTQEISLDFVCPQGLAAFATNGNTYVRNIDLTVEFSKVGEDIWRPYNDLNYVFDYVHAGGANIFSDRAGTCLPLVSSNYTLISRSAETYFSNGTGWWRRYTSKWGYKKGATSMALKNGEAVVGEALYISGVFAGKIASISSSSVSGYSNYNFESPLDHDVLIFTTESQQQISGNFPIFIGEHLVGSASLTDKIIIRYLSMGAARISGNNQQQIYATIKFKPKEISQYKIRVTRKTSSSEYTFRTFDKLTLASISTRFDRQPIITDKRHVFLELRIRATNQLNGSISNLSAVAESILDVWDGTQWVKEKTSNPAWVFCDLITGSLNKRALSKSRLHLPTIVEWANFCDEIPTAPPSQEFILPRFTSNFVLDFDTTLQSMINSVCNSAQASLNIVDGKYGVLIDKLKTVPVQVFTPRNSSGFTSTRSYDQTFHALKIKYIDPFNNWEVSEVTVYDQGYDENTATEFDELSTFACTNYEQAWRFGRYMLAQSRLRKESISISVDFEYLVCTRGDYVQVTQDVMRVGGRPARVKEITGPDTVKIDDAIDTLAGVDYGYVYRGVNGINTSSCDVLDSDEFRLYGDMPQVGDLIIIGEVGKVVFDCIVKSINPGGDLNATLELVEKADAIYLAESSDILPQYDPQLTLNVDVANATPPKVEDLAVVANTWRVLGNAYQYYIDLDWDIPVGAAFETFEIYVDNGSGYELTDFTKKSLYEYIVNPADLNIPHSFKVLAVSSTGKKIPLIEAPFVTATPVKKITPPSDVQALYINITNQVIQLDWPAVLDPDLKDYIIRYSPKTVGATWEASIPLLRVDKSSTLASTQGRTGTYFIKALDLNGNESVKAGIALTSIPNLFDLNVISETNDFPALAGELVTVETDSVGLMLKRLLSGGTLTNQYYSEGFYYYENFLDLGEIYTVRLQSLIEAEGFTVGDLMSNWLDLSTLTAMSLAGRSDWDVETQYRATDSFNVMSEWSSLTDVTPMSEGDVDNWTPWKKFIMGDATGRIFQFRLRLISNTANVTPRVFDGVIRADMPDRLESYNNLIAPVEGLEIVYSPAFKGPGASPNIQITQDNAETGDYYNLENKTLNGFKITFYDKNGVAVIRQFDAAIKGYGRKALAVI